MKVLSLFILINVLTVEVFAQDLNVLSLTKTINGEFEYFMPDELGNLFGLTKNGQLKKYNLLESIFVVVSAQTGCSTRLNLKILLTQF